MNVLLRFIIFHLMLIHLSYTGTAQKYVVVEADRPDYYKSSKAILNSGVRYKSDWEYLIYGGHVTTEKIKFGEHRYNSIGLIDESINLLPDGTKTSILIYSYLKNNLIKSRVEYTPEGEILKEQIYNYSDNNRLQEINWYSYGGLIYKKVSFEIDEQHKTVTQFNWYSPDSISSKFIVFYTDLKSGYQKEIWEYEGDDKLQRKRLINRLDNFSIDTEEFRNLDGTLMYYLKYNYNPNGRLLNKERLYPNGARAKQEEYNYTPKGLLMAEIDYNKKGEIVRYFKYTYD